MSLTRPGSGGMGGEVREALAPINDVGGAIDDGCAVRFSKVVRYGRCFERPIPGGMGGEVTREALINGVGSALDDRCAVRQSMAFENLCFVAAGTGIFLV